GPSVRPSDMRGNAETRLRKLAEQDALDGLILGRAGLERLGLAGHITEILDPSWMLPAVGQGALGLECRADDITSGEIVAKINDSATMQAVLAERAMLRGLGGGCQVPIGAAAHIDGARLTLSGTVLPPDGSRRVAGQIAGPAEQAEPLGLRLARDL